MVEWSVRAALDFAGGPVVVVTGHRAEEVEAVLPPAATHVRNHRWREGMASSLRVGLDALPERVDAAIVALAR